MPINRRAIIHMGGKKELKNRQVLKLKTPNKQIFKNTSEQKPISFIIDTQAKQKKTKIENLIHPKDISKYNIKDTHVNVNEFKYYDVKQMEKFEEEKKIKKAEELQKITESIKEKFSKDKKLKEQRKQMGMGTFLQDLNFPMKYYQDIKKEFAEFKKDFFLDDAGEEEKYNVLRFKLHNQYKLSSDDRLKLSNIKKVYNKGALSVWTEKNKLSPNESFIKKIMLKNFKQIIVDTDRNILVFVNNACMGFNDYDLLQTNTDPWKTPFYFYTVQLILFFQYYFLKHSNLDEWYVDFHSGVFSKHTDGKPLIDLLNKTIYTSVTNGNKGVNHSFIKKFVSLKRKDSWENLDHEHTYTQSDLNMFIKTIQSTSNINERTFNINDAAALHTHIFFKQKLQLFFTNHLINGKDKKFGLKYACKIMNLANFIDPYLFDEFWDYINGKLKTFYDQKENKDKPTGNPNIETIKLGELHMNHEKYNKFNPTQQWVHSEQKKFNASRGEEEEPFTVTEIVEKIEQMDSPLNAHHTAFLDITKKMKIGKLLTSTLDPDSFVPADFDCGRTKMSWWYNFTQQSITEWQWKSGINSFTEEFNGSNKDSRIYMKCLYKYGIDGCILLNLIHFKNMRTSINLNKKNHLRNLKEIMSGDNYKTENIYNHARDNLEMLETLQFVEKEKQHDFAYKESKYKIIQTMVQGLKTGFYLSGRKPELTCKGIQYDFKKNINEYNCSPADKLTLVKEAPNNPYFNKFLNPLTCNLEETYVKHFDYCIEQIEKQHGSLKEYNEKFDQLFSNSLILYKNGFMGEGRLKEIKQKNKGITIVDKLTDIWDIHKNDKRIYFPKRDGIDDELLSRIDGWLGDFKTNTLRHALDGIYHIDYDSFMKKSKKLLVPFVSTTLRKKKNRNIFSKDFEWNDSDAPLYDSEKTKLLWPRNSGRPFIFINKYQFLYADEKKPGDSTPRKLKIKKKIYKTNEIADKIKNANLIGMTKDKKIGNAIPDYWFDREYPFKNKDIITHIKLKTLIDSGYDKYKIIVKDINQKLLEGGIIESLPEVVEESPENDGRELVNPGDTEEKRRELAEKTPEEEEEAKRVEAERIAQKQLTDAQKRSAEIDKVAKKMDERLEEQDKDPKMVFIEKLLIEKPQITDEKLIEEFNKNNDFKGTRETALKAIINTARRNLLSEEDSDEDDSNLPAPEEGSKEQDPKKAEAEKQLREMYNLKIDKIPEDGDCLFEAFRRFLVSQKTSIKVPSIALLRKEIASHVQKNWGTFGQFVNTELYNDAEDYFKKMIAMKPDGKAPRARFGSEVEMKAFEELYKANNFKVQVLKWRNESQSFDELRDFKKDKINDSKTLTIYNTGDLHYEYLLPITQSGGGNNVYINKCKNHRHKRTRKFRIRFKNVGGWVHLNKPKKKTRRRY